MDVVVAGVGLALAGADGIGDLLRPPPAPVSPADPAARTRRRGLRYKDRASRLAMCAAEDALREAGLTDGAGILTVARESVAVVASSNFGNLDTVCRVASVLEEETTYDLSPMDLPNASSNVIASSVALLAGLRGPNLMLCNGPTSGLDAVYWAAQLIAAGRCARAVVVGVEPRNDVVARLSGTPEADLLDGAIALVLESGAAARSRGATSLARLGGYARAAGFAECVGQLLAGGGASLGIWFTPERFAADQVPAGVTRHDLTAAFGRASGALGVLQCAAAVGWFAAGASGTALATSGDGTGDAVAGMLLRPPGSGRT